MLRMTGKGCCVKNDGEGMLRLDVPCHTERGEVLEVCEWCICNDLRFFTSLCWVQNDRGRSAAFGMTVKGCCVRNDRIDLLFRSRMLCALSVIRT